MRTRHARAVVAALAALAACPSAAAAADPPYGVTAPVEHRVAMADGTEIAVDVYYPADPASGERAAGSFPVVLSITPYGKRSAVTTSASGPGDDGANLGGDGHFPYLVRRGYVNVVADVRGAGSSDGHFELFGPNERRDGVELVHWSARLPGSNGRVGMAGFSYGGLNEIFTAGLIGPGSPLKAIAPGTAGIDLYRDLAFGGGIPNVEFALAWSALRGTMVSAAPDEPQEDPPRAAATPPQRLADYAQLDAQLYAEIDTGGPRSFDGPFWAERRPRDYLAGVVRNGVPALLVSGWFDVYQRGVPLEYAALQNLYARAHPRRGRKRPKPFGPMPRDARPTGRYQAILGPWFHNATVLGEPLQRQLLRWFDTWLKDAPTGMDRERKPLHVYELGARRWLDAARFPFPQARERTLYLDGARSGTARASLNDGTLTERRPAAAEGSDQLPWTPAGSPCNRHSDQWNTGLAQYFTALAGTPSNPCWSEDGTTQAGALTYTTEPFERDATVAGPVSATVELASSTPDAQVVVTLEDVAPDGRSFPLTTGALLGSHRALDPSLSWRGPGGGTIVPYHPYTKEASRPLAPGAVERLDVEVYSTFARIARGHRLRVTLSSSVTHLVPTAPQAASLAGGRYAIQRNRAHASFVNVPIAEPDRMGTSPVAWGGCNGSC